MLKLQGEFLLRCRGPKGRVLWSQKVPNGIVSVGLTDILSVYFAGGSASANWYIGLIDNTSFSALSSADTMSSHAGWSELTSYDGSTRKAFTNLTASNALILNTVAASFVMSADATIKGIFIVNNATRGGSTGTLWSTAALASARVLRSGQTLEVVYRLTAGGGGG